MTTALFVSGICLLILGLLNLFKNFGSRKDRPLDDIAVDKGPAPKKLVPPPPGVCQWEYKAFNRRVSEAELNDLGFEGWNLVNHTAVVGPGGSAQYYVFKRKVLRSNTDIEL